MSKSDGRRKKGLGLFGLVTAAMFGMWVKESMPSHTAEARSTAQAAAVVEPVATGGGFPTGAVVAAGVVALVVGVVVWLVVGKIRDMIEDRRAAEATRIDLARQAQERRQKELAPRLWRYTLAGTTSNGAQGRVTDVIEFPPSSSREAVRREVLRRALAKDPHAQLVAKIELVSK